MTDVFAEQYAAAYDSVYADKNYAAETDAVCKLIARHEHGKTHRLLDFGCGTGRHCVQFAQRGFDVTGVDLSDAMLARARSRVEQAKLSSKIDFSRGDIRTFVSDQKCDAVLMNFNVLGYMASNDDLLAAFSNARANLRESGLFIADFWYGPAVVADPPGESKREFSTPDGLITRTSSGQHLMHEQSCLIAIKISRSQDGSVVDEGVETHRVRYFFPLELELALRVSGFRLLGITGFPDIDARPDERNWVAALVAVAI